MPDTMTVAPDPEAVFTARRINLEGPEADPRGHFARVKLHAEDLLALLMSKDRRASRNVLDRLVRTRFLSVCERCLCTSAAKLSGNAARFDGWVHAHHEELNALVDSLFTPEQRSVLIDSAERYQTDIETKLYSGAPSFAELRLVQDWLFQPLEQKFRARFGDWAPRPRGTRA